MLVGGDLSLQTGEFVAAGCGRRAGSARSGCGGTSDVEKAQRSACPFRDGIGHSAESSKGTHRFLRWPKACLSSASICAATCSPTAPIVYTEMPSPERCKLRGDLIDVVLQAAPGIRFTRRGP